MISTSAAYQAAIVGSPRHIEILAVVDISDPDMIWGKLTGSSLAPWSQAGEVHDKRMSAPKRYATLEPGRWLLDGSFEPLPDDDTATGAGGVSGALSGQDGTFSPACWMQQAFSGVDVLQALSIFFSTDPVDGVPVDFTVEVLSGGQVFHTETITGNTDTQIAMKGFTVQAPDAIKITCTKWSLPRRRMRIVEIIAGVYEQWTPRMLASFSSVQQGDFSCLSLPYGSVTLSMDNSDGRFEPRRKDSLFQSIEARQGLQIQIGVRTASGAVERCGLGTFYQYGDGWKSSDNGLTMTWYLVDIIGLLSARTFIPPATLPTTLDGWMAAVVAQLGTNFADKYHVDPNYQATQLVANDVEAVTGKKCADIIRWACMAAGCWPRADAQTGRLTAEPLWSQGNKLTLSNLTAYPNMQANKSLAALIFHLADGSDTEIVVSGNATSSEDTITIENPFIHTRAQAFTAARLILACYGGNVINTTGRGDPSSEIGDVDTVWLDKSNAAAGRRQAQTFQIQDGVLQGCTSQLLQADGSYLYTEYAMITASGTWTAPAGVTRLRLVVGQGGQGGSIGHDGILEHGNGKVNAARGEDGIDGNGGRIWYGVVDINAGQSFAVQIGQGGAASAVLDVPGAEGGHTTFGAYTSANGQIYPNGYTDIANGLTYARAGVELPTDGTGDGGQGGPGGAPGAGHYSTWTDINGGKHTNYHEDKAPGPGSPGVKGGSGFVLVSWEKVSA